MPGFVDRRFVAGFVSVFVLIAGVFVFMATRPGAGAQAPSDVFICQVASVHDGDTLRCSDGTRIRLSGINARESDGSCSTGHPCPEETAEAARAMLENHALGRRLHCRRVGASYNRIVAWCAEGGRDLSCAMIGTGTAVRWPRHDPEGRLREC